MLPHKKAVLPCLDHITLELASQVYESAEDTYLLCDALLCDLEDIISRQPQQLLEVGCGSGCVITYLCTLLKSHGLDFRALAVDINPVALATTRETARLNQVEVEVITSNLFSAIEGSHRGSIDVMLFNPPYVPTPSEEIAGNGIEASWAGGINGREVIDKFLPGIKSMLSPRGVLYMILVQENLPDEIVAILSADSLAAQVVYRTKAVNENLMVLKVQHSS